MTGEPVRRASSAVERGELGPVLWLVDVQRRDRCLEHVAVAPAERQSAIDGGPSLLDLVVVPERAILVAEEDHRVVRESRVAPRVVDEHQREQPVHLGLVGHQLGERAAEPDRLRSEVASPAVALVEDQVDDGEHGGQSIGEQMGRRDAKRIPAALIFRFARTRRLAIVSSGTRKARAMSSVRSPPSVRSVRARPARRARERGGST